MGDFPIQVIVFPVIALAVVIYFMVYRKKMLANYDQQYANFRAGQLAQRLGLNLVQGDAGFNFFVKHANVDVMRGPSDGKPLHVEVRMEGQPYGVPLELYYLYRVEQESGFSGVTWRTWSDCRMTAKPKAAFPPFEVVSRNAPLGPIAAKQPLPKTPSGNPMVDSMYEVTTQEPGMAKLLGELLPAYTTFSNSGIHLVGDGKSVSFVMREDKAPLLANALYFAEAMGQQVSELARRVGG